MAQANRPNAVRVAKGHESVTEDHDHDGIAASAPLVYPGHGREHRLRRQVVVALALQFVGEHVEQDLGIGARVQVPPILANQQVFQLFRIRQVAVVREADAVRRVDVERLRLGNTRRARRRIAHVTDAGAARQRQHVTRAEDVADQPRGLARAQHATVVDRDSRGVLATVLQHGERVIDRLIDRRVTHDSNDSAHRNCPA